MKNHPSFALWPTLFLALVALSSAAHAIMPVPAETPSRSGCIAAYGNRSMGQILSMIEGVPMSDEEREYAQEKLYKLIAKVSRLTDVHFAQYDVEEVLREGNRAGTFCSGRRPWGWYKIKHHLVRQLEGRLLGEQLNERIRSFEEDAQY